MPEIAADGAYATFINTFRCDPADQDEVVRINVEIVDRVASAFPGFISASVHKSIDGTCVVNYLQWESPEDLAAMQHSSEFRAVARRLAGLVQFEPHECRVAYVTERPPDAPRRSRLSPNRSSRVLAMGLPAPSAGRTALVTGASAGIGTELARQLAGRGHHVTLVARRRDRLEELAAELARAFGVEPAVHAADLGDATEREEAVSAVRAAGREVVILCNNAGIGSFGRLWELDPDGEMRQVRLNVEALHALTLAFLPEMVRRGEGAVLNTGSLGGLQPQPSNATYAATKAFVHSLSEALHAELAGTGVTCTVLAPGPVKTEFAEAAGVGTFNDRGPAFLWGTPEEVARAGLEGLASGRRVVHPRVSDRVAGALGRYAPHWALLPILQRAMTRSLPSDRT